MTKAGEKSKTINLELAEQISTTEPCVNLGGQHTISRDDSIRHDGPNDASARLQACHPPEVGQGGASVFYFTNKRKDSLTTQIVDGIFDAINILRDHSKKRPDKKSITDYLTKKLGADKGAVLQALQSLIDAERERIHYLMNLKN